MRIKNKEIRRRRHRKEQHVKSVLKGIAEQFANKPKAAVAEKAAPKKAPAAKKPAAKKVAEEKPAAKKTVTKKKAAEPAAE